MSGNAPGPRLRIAVLNRHFGYRFGGAERYAAAIVEELAPRHDIHVFAQDIEHDFPGVSYHRMSRPLAKPRWVNQLWFAWQTWRLTRQGFDAVHSHENTWHGDLQTVHVRPFRVGLFHGKRSARRMLRWLSLFTSPRLLTYWWLEAARLRPRPRRHIIATSRQVMTETLQAYPGTAHCMHVIAPGVHLPQRPPDPGQARQALGLPKAVPLALFVGNDYARKGLRALLQALPLVPSLHLAVVGNTGQMPVFQRQVIELGLADRVHFLGPLTNMTPAYEAADLLVHPTTEDTYAMVVLEAMAHGLPVIVSGPSHCGIAADLTPNTQALMLDNPRDASAIAHQLSRLLDSPQLQHQLRTAGAEFARERSWHAAAAAHEALFRRVAQNKD